MADTLDRLTAIITEHTLPGLDLTTETELATCLDEVNRVCSLPFWLEEMTGTIPTDAELLSWVTISDVVRWVQLVERRAA